MDCHTSGKTKKKTGISSQKNENRLGMSMAFLAIIMIHCCSWNQQHLFRQKQAKYIAREQELQQQIDAENTRTEELKEN